MNEPEDTPQQEPDREDTAGEDERPHTHTVPPEIVTSAIKMLGGRDVHEIGFRGSALRQTARFVEANLRPHVIDIEDPITGTEAPAILTKDGIKEVPSTIFEGYLERPRYRRGTATVTDLASFIEHANRFKSESSLLFADDNRDSPKLTAVLDYHPAGADSDPAFGRHRTLYNFPVSDEWKAWNATNNKPMAMVEFAEFLEDRVIDVVLPNEVNFTDEQKRFIDTLGGVGQIATPTKLIELSRGLQVFENSVVKEAHKLSSGEGQIQFQSEHVDAKGEALIIPTMFLIAIPVFSNDAPYLVIARLRYRVRGGLSFYYELWRTDRVFDHAFTMAGERAKTETGLPLLLGAPEA